MITGLECCGEWVCGCVGTFYCRAGFLSLNARGWVGHEPEIGYCNKGSSEHYYYYFETKRSIPQTLVPNRWIVPLVLAPLYCIILFIIYLGTFVSPVWV